MKHFAIFILPGIERSYLFYFVISAETLFRISFFASVVTFLIALILFPWIFKLLSKVKLLTKLHAGSGDPANGMTTVFVIFCNKPVKSPNSLIVDLMLLKLCPSRPVTSKRSSANASANRSMRVFLAKVVFDSDMSCSINGEVLIIHVSGECRSPWGTPLLMLKLLLSDPLSQIILAVCPPIMVFNRPIILCGKLKSLITV